MQPTYSVSARNKLVSRPVMEFLQDRFPNLAINQVDSVFGFVDEKSTLYGGRPYMRPELSDADVNKLAQLGIGLRLPLTNHVVTESEYEQNRAFLERYHRSGNSLIIVNDQLATWVRRDYPLYQLEASCIKDLKSVSAISKALELYDVLVPAASMNDDIAFLESLPEKNRVRLFANAGCAYTCPAKICYPAISQMNKYEGARFKCSQPLKHRELIGMVDFAVERFIAMGFSKFKLLRGKGLFQHDTAW